MQNSPKFILVYDIMFLLSDVFTSGFSLPNQKEVNKF